MRAAASIAAALLASAAAFGADGRLPDGPAGRAAASPFRHVVVISVDGLRPDAIDGPEDGELPGFRRLLRGPHTMQARADAEMTITLPNHVSMVTGRPVGGPAGHGWRENGDPPAAKDGGTLHRRNGSYVAGMFDVAHDRGAATALIATKNKFALVTQSYDDAAGAADTVGRDDGKDKVDLFACVRTSRMAREAAASWLRAREGPSLTLLHFGAPDGAGHAKGWDMAANSPYRAAIAEVDGEIAALLAAFDADERLRGQVAVILTADHGGGVPFISHSDPRARVNYVIPFAVWLGADGTPAELAALNADRRAIAPADSHVGNDAAPQPIRNAEAGNLALQLMGMPAIPGSVANARQDLLLAEVQAP